MFQLKKKAFKNAFMVWAFKSILSLLTEEPAFGALPYQAGEETPILEGSRSQEAVKNLRASALQGLENPEDKEVISHLLNRMEKDPSFQKTVIRLVLQVLDHERVLPRAMEKLQERTLKREQAKERERMESIGKNLKKRAQSLKEATLFSINPPGVPPQDPPIFMIMDPRCGHCHRALRDFSEPDKPELKYNVSVLVMEDPDQGGLSSLMAAAKKSGKLQEFLNTDSSQYQTLKEVKNHLKAVSQDLDIPLQVLQRDLENSDYREATKKAKDLGEQVEILGTPTFFYKGKVITGYMSLEHLQSEIVKKPEGPADDQDS